MKNKIFVEPFKENQELETIPVDKSVYPKNQLKRKTFKKDFVLEIDSEAINFRKYPEYKGHTFIIFPDDKLKTA